MPRSLFAAALLVVSATAHAQQPLHLIPQPRSATPKATIPLQAGIRFTCGTPCDPEDAFAIDEIKATLAARGIAITDAASAPHVLVLRTSTALGRAVAAEAGAATFPAEMHAEGYAIIPDGDPARSGGLALAADTSAGIFYALQTVKQLILDPTSTSPASLQTAIIRDFPAMKYRGLHDDLSRGPVPTLDFQKKLIRTLAAYKDNLYSPYFEHTQQYASNPVPAPPGGSISAADARELATYAARYHVMIVPEQEAFGHLRHFLIAEQYQQLAETPHGAVLAPGQPGSLSLIKDWFTELAALYPSPFLHIGADETDDLGRGQTKAAVDAGGKQGLASVYLDFMQKIDTTLRPLNRRLLFWGDVAQDSPDLLKAMPASFKADTIAIGWQYNPSAIGFAQYLKPFSDAGFETWVAPGINNWNRIYPNYNNGLVNIQQFTRDGQKMGATGQLNTIWYDDGEALASNNWYGILFGAAAAWQAGQSSIVDFQQSYGPVFHGDATGKLDEAQKEIMAAHDLIKSVKMGDGSDLIFWADPWAPDQATNMARLRPIVSDLRLHAERAITLIAQARAAYPCVYSLTFNGAIPPTPGSSCPEDRSPIPGSSGPDSRARMSRNSEGFLYSPINTHPSDPTALREPDAIDALELGARRLDFVGLKLQLADEITQIYAQAQAQAVGPKNTGPNRIRTLPSVAALLSDINGVNGRIQDIKDGYALLRDLYEQSWRRTNRPYALRQILEHYDYTIGIWLTRMDKARSVQRQWESTRTLPANADAGIPVPVKP